MPMIFFYTLALREKKSIFGVIQSECGKIRTRITLNTDTIYTVLRTSENQRLFSDIFRGIERERLHEMGK